MNIVKNHRILCGGFCFFVLKVINIRIFLEIAYYALDINFKNNFSLVWEVLYICSDFKKHKNKHIHNTMKRNLIFLSFLLPAIAYSQDLIKKTLTGVDGNIDNFIKYGYKYDLESSGSIANRWHGIDATITVGAAESNKMHFKLYSGTSNNNPPITVMTLQGDRKVGINFPNPTSTLTVYDAGPVGSNQFELRSNHLRNPDRYFMKNIIYGTGSEDVTFFLRHDGQMFVDGKVGIGTTTPQAKLDVAGTLRSVSHTISDYSPVLFLDRNVNNGGYVQGVQTRLSDGTNNWFFGNLHGDTFLITTGDYAGPQQFVINRNGNAALKGKLEAKEIKVTLTPTADFVFENDYTLPKLENVEKYVKEEKHLPEIASAKEMVKEGVNVGEFQIKLLQKIEELTLYVIQLNKDVKKLEEENKQLKQKGILTE